MKKLKALLLSALMVMSVSLVPTYATVYAQTSKEAVCEGIGIAGEEGCAAEGGDARVKEVVKLAIQIFQMIVGIISVFIITIAGLGYVTSGGDASKLKTARDRILYAAIGLVVVVLAQVIVSFVLNRVA